MLWLFGFRHLLRHPSTTRIPTKLSSLGHGNSVGNKKGAMEYGRDGLASDTVVGALSGDNMSSERIKDLSVIWDDDHTNEINLNLNESSDPIGDESDDDVMMGSLTDAPTVYEKRGDDHMKATLPHAPQSYFTSYIKFLKNPSCSVDEVVPFDQRNPTNKTPKVKTSNMKSKTVKSSGMSATAQLMAQAKLKKTKLDAQM